MSDSPAQSTENVLDAPLPSLAKLIDQESLVEIAQSFSELYGIGIKIFDAEDQRLVDIRAGTQDHCGYLFSVHPTRTQCTATVSKIRKEALVAAPKMTEVQCFSGLTYRIVPITYDYSYCGRLIFGPFAPPSVSRSPESLRQYEDQGLDYDTLNGYFSSAPKADDETVERVLNHVVSMLEVLVHASYKMWITQELHVSSVSAAFKDLERVNTELQGANTRLKELDRMKSNFIATVSHELRTPLTSVIGYSEMLLEGMAGEINEEQRNYVQTILEKGESLLGLISQVLDLSRIESGNVLIRKELTDPREIASLSISDVTPQARKKNLILSVDVSPTVRDIKVDGDKIRRVVTNLLGNAVKFTPDSGDVTLAMDVLDDYIPPNSNRGRFDPEESEYLRIRVIDSGVGIPKEQLEQVFESFFQVDNSSTREHGGTGLGLSIVRNFVRGHEGSVAVESDSGKGCTFTVLIPYLSPEDAIGRVRDGIGAEVRF